MKDLVLTGCAGFIGINFLREMLETKSFKQFDNIISIDKMEDVGKYNEEDYTELCKKMDIDYLKSSVENMPILTVEECVVFNFASESHVDNSILDPFSIYKENCEILPALINSIGTENIDVLYHISTDEVFGDLFLAFDPGVDRGFDVHGKFNPKNPYSASKASQEMFLESMKNTFEIPVKIIRLANQYGCNQFPEKMIPKALHGAVRGETIKLYGKGLNKRQWTDVGITCKILVDILNEKLPFEDVLHIADKDSLKTNLEVCESLKKVLLKNGVESVVEHVEDRKGHDLCYYLETDMYVDNYFQDSKSFEQNLETILKKDFIGFLGLNT